jgi:hypothetical protein
MERILRTIHITKKNLQIVQLICVYINKCASVFVINNILSKLVIYV